MTKTFKACSRPPWDVSHAVNSSLSFLASCHSVAAWRITLYATAGHTPLISVHYSWGITEIEFSKIVLVTNKVSGIKSLLWGEKSNIRGDLRRSMCLLKVRILCYTRYYFFVRKVINRSKTNGNGDKHNKRSQGKESKKIIRQNAARANGRKGRAISK